jgi:hypothetical protein
MTYKLEVCLSCWAIGRLQSYGIWANLGFFYIVDISRMTARIVQEYRPQILTKKAQYIGPRSDPCGKNYLAEVTLTNNSIFSGK